MSVASKPRRVVRVVRSDGRRSATGWVGVVPRLQRSGEQSWLRPVPRSFPARPSEGIRVTAPQGCHVQAMAAFVALAAEGLEVSLHATPDAEGGDPVFEVRVATPMGSSFVALGTAAVRAAEEHGGEAVYLHPDLAIRWPADV